MLGEATLATGSAVTGRHRGALSESTRARDRDERRREESDPSA